MNYRKDINGLRAIALVMIVCFHFGVAGFSGGIIGVDIFFVISGYLMTGIIFSRLRNHKFTFTEFYLHRARRIIPALACLCLCLMLLGALFLLKSDFKDLSRYIRKAILFISNTDISEANNYFAGSAKENWLLHTWTLSVEWQFYAIYPIIITALYKFLGEKIAKYSIILLFFASLTASIIFTPIYPAAAYYLLPIRAWAMLAGGVIYLFPFSNETIRWPLWVIGCLLIVISFIIFNPSYLWPGYFALLPVIGTALIVVADRPSFITDNRLFQWLGNISYSYYLWHWPIVVFLIATGWIDSIAFIVLGIALSTVCGFLSYYFVEIRFKLKHANYVEIIKYTVMVLLIYFAAKEMSSSISRDKIPRLPHVDFLERHNQKNPLVDQCLLFNKTYTSYPECKSGSGEVSAIVFGNSMGDSMFNAVKTANEKGATLQWTYAGCFTGDPSSDTEGCKKFIVDKVNQLKQEYLGVPVVFITNMSISPDNDNYFSDIICSVSQNHPTYVVVPTPIMSRNVPKALSLGAGSQKLNLNDYLQKQVEPRRATLNKLSLNCGAVILDPKPYLCDQAVCYGDKEGKPLYYDGGHLNENSGPLLSPMFKRIFESYKSVN